MRMVQKEELHFCNLKGERDSSVDDYFVYKDDKNSSLCPFTASLDVSGNYQPAPLNTSMHLEQMVGELVSIKETNFRF